MSLIDRISELNRLDNQFLIQNDRKSTTKQEHCSNLDKLAELQK